MYSKIYKMTETEKKYKTFADYYKDPEFKAKHNAYMLGTVECVWGASSLRCNLPRHHKTKKHLKAMYAMVVINPEFDLNKIILKNKVTQRDKYKLRIYSIIYILNLNDTKNTSTS